MSDSQSALRELQKFLGNFKSLLPILENAATIEQEVKAGEARIVAMKMEAGELAEKLATSVELAKQNDEYSLKKIREANDEAAKIKSDADAYAQKIMASAEANGVKIVNDAIAKARGQESEADRYHEEANSLLFQVKELTATRDALKTELERLKKQFA